MIVGRTTFIAKRAQRPKALRLWKEWAAKHPDLTVRIYRHTTGSSQRFSIDIEYESMAEMEKFGNEWYMSPEFKAFFEKMDPLLIEGGSFEILGVV